MRVPDDVTLLWTDDLYALVTLVLVQSLILNLLGMGM